MKRTLNIALLTAMALASSLQAADGPIPSGLGTGGKSVPYDPQVPEEFRARGGLPNFFHKLKAGGPVRIAYLGGSITAASGWRPKTFAWFKTNWPKAELVEINAAISGTGSDYGACRLAGDVLRHKPDLVFMEHRVNGSAGFDGTTVEGIVRQIWKADPTTDICLVYTINQGMLRDFYSNRSPRFGSVMETVANGYGIPSIDLGVEVVRLEKAGKLIFKTNAAPPGIIPFAADGTHPGDAGHDVYKEVIARSMRVMEPLSTKGPHALPPVMFPGCWEEAGLLPSLSVNRSAGFEPVDTNKDPVYRDDFGRTHAMLRGASKCTSAGETVTVTWTGTCLGFSDIPQGTGTVVEVTVDGGAPLVFKRAQYEKKKYARFFYLPEMKYGKHTAVLTVKALTEETAFYSGQLLFIGKTNL